MGCSAFAERLRAVIAARRARRPELARLCGVTPQAVQKWCDGAAMPSSGSFLTICKHLNCSAEWLLYGHALDFHGTQTAPDGKHAKYWVREALAELKEQGLL